MSQSQLSSSKGCIEFYLAVSSDTCCDKLWATATCDRGCIEFCMAVSIRTNSVKRGKQRRHLVPGGMQQSIPISSGCGGLGVWRWRWARRLAKLKAGAPTSIQDAEQIFTDHVCQPGSAQLTLVCQFSKSTLVYQFAKSTAILWLTANKQLDSVN